MARNELEETFSTLELSLPSEFTEKDLVLEDIQEMSAAIKDQLGSAKETLDSLVARHIPAFMKKYSSTNDLEKATSNLKYSIERTLKFLSSVQSPRGCEVAFEDQQEALNAKLQGFQNVLNRIFKYQALYESNNNIRALINCGEIELASELMLSLEKDLEIIYEDLTENKEAEKENTLPSIEGQGFSFKNACDALILETARTHASLVRLVEDLWHKMINFSTEEGYVKCSIYQFVQKSTEQLEHTESFCHEAGDDLTKTNVIKLYHLICASIRLNCIYKYVTDDLAKNFFHKILLPLIGNFDATFQAEDTEETYTFIVNFEGNALKDVEEVVKVWENVHAFEDKFDKVIGNLQEVYTCFRYCFTEKEYDTTLFDFEFLSKYFWGNSSSIVGSTVQSSNKDCVIHVLSQILYLNTPKSSTKLLPLKINSLLRTVTAFEDYIESINLSSTSKKIKPLSAYLANISKRITEKHANEILYKAKTIICGDYYRTVHISEANSRSSHVNFRNFKAFLTHSKADSVSEALGIKSSGNLSDKVLSSVKEFVDSKLKLPDASTEIAANRPFFKHISSDFQLPEMLISKGAADLVELCYSLLDTVVLQEKIKNQDTLFLLKAIELCRDVFYLAYSLTYDVHKETIQKNLKYAAVYFNDCEFFSHTLGTFSFTYHHFLPAEVSANFILLDLIPKFRTKGNANMDNILLEQKSHIFDALMQLQKENAYNFSKAGDRLACVKGIVQKSTEHLRTLIKEWKFVLADVKFAIFMGSISDFCFDQLGKVLLSPQKDIMSNESFNVLELVDLRSTFEHFLRFVFNDMFSLKNLKISKQPELDAELSIGKIVPSYLKFEQMKNILNETLSKSILSDLILQGKLYLLTNEEGKFFSDFLFSN